MRNKKNILFVPHHHYDRIIKTRGQEIAKSLNNYYNIYYLTWAHTFSAKKIIKLLFVLKRIFTFPSIIKTQYFNLLQIPLVEIYSLPKISYFFNKLNIFLRYYIKKLDIDIIFSESLFSLDFSHLNKKFIYDIVDYHPGINTNEKNFLKNFLANQIKKADKVIVVSTQLKKIIEKDYKKEVVVVPNGVWIEDIRNANPMKVIKKYKLKNKFVIGYIGCHCWEWCGLNFLIKVFEKVNEKITDAVLFIVGPVSKNYYCREKIKNVIFTGPVYGEISPYFKAIDVGVLPIDKIPFTDASFQIKILEYTAARKFVIATPLEELKVINLSNVILVEQNIEKWTEAIISLKNKQWTNNWDKEITGFHWKNIGEKIKEIIES